jgi:hypothetical protein
MKVSEYIKSKNYSTNEFIGLSLSFLSVVLTIYWFLKSRIIDLNGGCGNDGLTYCSMALGNVEFEPFSRRTFLPAIVKFLGIENIVLTFYTLNSIFILGSIYFSYLILKKFNYKNRFLIVGLILLNPHIIRWLFAYPVVTDFLGLMLVSMFFYYFMIIQRQETRIIVLGSILTILCFVRENVPLIMGAGVLLWSLYVKRRVIESILLTLIAVLFTIISFGQPSTINTVQETNLVELAKDQISFFTQSPQNFLMFVYFAFFGLTLTAIKAISLMPKSSDSYGGIYFALLVMTITSPLFGGEARHFVLGSIIFQIYFLLKVDSPRVISFYMISTVAFWNLGAFGDGSIESFMRLFGQRFVPLEVTLDLLKTGLFTWALMLAVYLFGKRVYGVLSHK